MSVALLGTAPALATVASNVAPPPGQAVTNTHAASVQLPSPFLHWMEGTEAEVLLVPEASAASVESGDLLASGEESVDMDASLEGAMTSWPASVSMWKQSQQANREWSGQGAYNRPDSAANVSAMGSHVFAAGASDLATGVATGKQLALPAEPMHPEGMDISAVSMLPRSTLVSRAVPLLESAAAVLPPIPVNKGLQPLLQALGQRIHVQQVQGGEVATVRLDPPQMGSLEIRIRQDGAGVQVHLQASHAEVGRQLNMLVDSLRQELQQRSSDASVTVAQSRASTSSGQGEQSRRDQPPAPQDAEIGLALQAWGNETLT